MSAVGIFLCSKSEEPFDIEQTKEVLTAVPAISNVTVKGLAPTGKTAVWGTFGPDDSDWVVLDAGLKPGLEYKTIRIDYAGSAAVKLALDIAKEFQKRQPIVFRIFDSEGTFALVIDEGTTLAELERGIDAEDKIVD